MGPPSGDRDAVKSLIFPSRHFHTRKSGNIATFQVWEMDRRFRCEIAEFESFLTIASVVQFPQSSGILATNTRASECLKNWWDRGLIVQRGDAVVSAEDYQNGS